MKAESLSDWASKKRSEELATHPETRALQPVEIYDLISGVLRERVK